MQGHLAVFEMKSSSSPASSHEVHMVDSVHYYYTQEPHKYRSSASVSATTGVKTADAALLQDLSLIRVL